MDGQYKENIEKQKKMFIFHLQVFSGKSKSVHNEEEHLDIDSNQGSRESM